MAEKTANGADAAAIAAAIARFESEFAGAPAVPEDAVGPWQRQALLEGVGAKQTIQDPQGGGARWQS
ncbi:MAG TPA: hypothetical protein VH268_04555 [Solirubrobacterales bacterium]|nr:hypothetical protein [Solirubrobacterales bacterium]